MIDTVKVYTFINEDLYYKIKDKTDVMCKYNSSKEIIYYQIVNGSLTGTYDSNLSVKVTEADKYRHKGYVLEIEGSYHKIIRGYNAYDGFYDLLEIALGFKNLVENGYDVILPDISDFYLQRVDITRVFDLHTQDQIKQYMSNLKLLSYPRRNTDTYCDFGVDTLYFKGTTTTLKIYNKLKEFRKNDRKKLRLFDNFDLVKFENDIQGFLRFECEIKKKKLKSLFNKDDIRLVDVKYGDLKKIWCDEFMKILKFKNNDINKVREKQSVLVRLKTFYSDSKANNLYSFFLSLKVDGYNVIRDNMSSSTFYRKISDLKDAGIDFSQNDFTILENSEIVDFDIFKAKEVV